MSICGVLQANATVTISLGPFLDDDDGATEKTGLTIQDTDIYLSKNGGAKANPNDLNNCTEDANGVYLKQINATDTNTEGILTVYCHPTDCLYVRQDYLVLAQASYISLFTAKDAGFMDVNIKTVGRADTQETEADNLESACANYSATRGLTGTSVPAAAADAAGGLVVSDAGGLDIDAMNTNINDIETDTNEIQGKLPTNKIMGSSDGADDDSTLNAILADTGTTLDNHLTDIKGTGFAKDTHSLTNIEGYADILDNATNGNAALRTELDGLQGTDGKCAISADAQDLSGSLDVNAKTITNGAITANAIATDAVDADALASDAITEIWNKAMSDLAAGSPSATCSVLTAINYLYEAWRNKTVVNGTNNEIELYKDDGSTKLCEADIADDGTDFSKGEYGAAD
jgi:hypothetical protein